MRWLLRSIAATAPLARTADHAASWYCRRSGFLVAWGPTPVIHPSPQQAESPLEGLVSGEALLFLPFPTFPVGVQWKSTVRCAQSWLDRVRQSSMRQGGLGERSHRLPTFSSLLDRTSVPQSRHPGQEPHRARARHAAGQATVRPPPP
jgi:hypothetical protein